MTDAEMASGTVVEHITHEADMRFDRFDRMLRDKYETLNDHTYTSTLKCRRCGSAAAQASAGAVLEGERRLGAARRCRRRATPRGPLLASPAAGE